MPLVIVDGPEAAGKSTLIAGLEKAWRDKEMGDVAVRRWGPVESWEEYLVPLTRDLDVIAKDPNGLILWDRSWASEWVYNLALRRGRDFFDPQIEQIEQILEGRVDVGRVMIVPDPDVLVERRAARVAAGHDDDLPVHPEHEYALFAYFGCTWGWATEDEFSPDEVLNALAIAKVMNVLSEILGDDVMEKISQGRKGEMQA